jgi:hypothetical protein
MLDKSNKRDSILEYSNSIMQLSSFKNYNSQEHVIPFKSKIPAIDGYAAATPGSYKIFF